MQGGTSSAAFFYLRFIKPQKNHEKMTPNPLPNNNHHPNKHLHPRTNMQALIPGESKDQARLKLRGL